MAKDTPAAVRSDADAGLWRLQRELLLNATVVLRNVLATPIENDEAIALVAQYPPGDGIV